MGIGECVLMKWEKMLLLLLLLVRLLSPAAYLALLVRFFFFSRLVRFYFQKAKSVASKQAFAFFPFPFLSFYFFFPFLPLNEINDYQGEQGAFSTRSNAHLRDFGVSDQMDYGKNGNYGIRWRKGGKKATKQERRRRRRIA